MAERRPRAGSRAPWDAALREAARGRVVVLGIGNELRGDDGAGSLVAQGLRRRHPGAAFDGGEAPENFVGPIRRAGPHTVVVVDAADFSGEPGEIRVVPAPFDEAGPTLGTHTLPIGTFLAALGEATGASVCLVAIQAVATEFGAVVTPEVAASVDGATRALMTILDATHRTTGTERRSDR